MAKKSIFATKKSNKDIYGKVIENQSAILKNH